MHVGQIDGKWFTTYHPVQESSLSQNNAGYVVVDFEMVQVCSQLSILRLRCYLTQRVAGRLRKGCCSSVKIEVQSSLLYSHILDCVSVV